MPPSYKDINYGLRPAKTIERKMICEALRRLSPFASVASYRYVGMGSPYFSDFSLFHKALGISDMHCIEKEIQDRLRFEFNLPYHCIKMHFGTTTEILPALPWEKRTVVWLDYDKALNLDQLGDIGYIVAQCGTGTVLIFTCNAHPPRLDRRIETLKANLENLVPMDADAEQLGGWNTAALYHRLISDQIQDRLIERNAVLAEVEKIHYRQLFHFRYADGARMLTVGGILFDAGQEGNLGACNFAHLPFVKDGSEACEIEIPNLTYRELRHLDSCLPNDSLDKVVLPGVPPSHVAKYARVYRYFPTFAEAEI